MKNLIIFAFAVILLDTMALPVSCVSCLSRHIHREPDDEVSVSVNAVRFDEHGGSKSIQVMSNTHWTVNVTQGFDRGWLCISPLQGSMDGVISVAANPNKEQTSRNCMLYIKAGDASTTVSVNQKGKEAPSGITISNNSTYTLEHFRVVFLNARMEKLTDTDFGTLSPSRSITADIPTSASEFYMATYGNKWYFSPNYDVSYTNISLTTAEVGNWSANSSNQRYAKPE